MEGLLAEYRAMTERALEEALPGESGRDLAGVLPEAMRYAVLGGGKRIRPLVVLSSCAAAGGDPGEALDGACSVEFVHAYSLVHDDLPAMDDDDFRRGKPSCHKAYGEATAILVGDALLTLAFEVLARKPTANRIRAVAELARAAGWRGLVGGQQLDLDATDARPETLDDLERIHLGKTAALFEVSAVLGGLLAGAEDGVVSDLRQLGRNVGLAFQHIDDLLDADHPQFAEEAAQRAEALLSASREILGRLPGDTEGLGEILYLLELRLATAVAQEGEAT